MYWTDTIKVTAFLVVIVAGLIAIMFSAAVGMTAWQCSEYEQVTGIETKMVIPNGCFLNIEGDWVYYHEYRAKMIAEKGLTHAGG